jgi:hypothetical protein
VSAVCLCKDQPENCQCTRRTAEMEASERRNRIHHGMKQAAMIQAGLMQRTADIPPGACVLCGAFPDGSLVEGEEPAGLGNL